MCCSPVATQAALRKPQKSLVHAHDVGHSQIQRLFPGMRVPMYKTNDSDDLHLMELISPSYELQRKLHATISRPMTQQLPPHTPSKSIDTTPRSKYKQTALKTLHTFPLSSKLNTKLFGSDHARPKSANEPKQRKKAVQQTSLDFDNLIPYNKSELSTQRTSGFESERRSGDSVSGQQKACDLRMVSKLWHQDCESSVEVQRQLGERLNEKYRERMLTNEKCKNGDFKAEVAQILKKLERAGAPQMATLNLKYELAVACVDEVLGDGMGEEYVRLEGYFLGPCSGVRILARRDAAVLKEIEGRVRQEYFDVQRIAGFMLDQLNCVVSC